MDLVSFMARFPLVKIATPEDNDRILLFYKDIPMSTDRLNLSYERGENFFDLLQYQGEKSFVFLFLNRDSTIGGMASLSLRTHFFQQVPKTAGYLGDLRLSPTMDRYTRLEWRNFYRALVTHANEIAEFGFCKFFYTAILDENEAAVLTFTRNKKGIIYNRLMSYEAVHVLGLFPWRRLLATTNQYQARLAYSQDFLRIKKFLASEQKKKYFGEYFLSEGADELDRRLRTWKNFALNDFIIVENSAQELVGVCCPWDSSSAKSAIVGKLSFDLTILGQWIKPLLGTAKLKENSPLKILYLTHLEILSTLNATEQTQVMEAMIDLIFRQGLARNFHLVSFLNYRTHSLLPLLRKRGLLLESTPSSLYQVTSEETPTSTPDLQPLQDQKFGLEMALA